MSRVTWVIPGTPTSLVRAHLKSWVIGDEANAARTQQQPIETADYVTDRTLINQCSALSGGRQHLRRRVGHHAGGDAATSAGVVLDCDGLTEPVGQLVGKEPANDVRAAAGRSADQDAQRALRPVLLRACGQRGASGQSCGERERWKISWMTL